MSIVNFVNPDLIQRLEAMVTDAAILVQMDREALPIFERLDAELTKARTAHSLREVSDPVIRARELVRLNKEVIAAC